MKRAKPVVTKFNEKTGKYEKLSVKAPKGQRRVGVDQNNKLVIYDDRGNVIGVQG
jgi:hypothetical protein